MNVIETTTTMTFEEVKKAVLDILDEGISKPEINEDYEHPEKDKDCAKLKELYCHTERDINYLIGIAIRYVIDNISELSTYQSLQFLFDACLLSDRYYSSYEIDPLKDKFEVHIEKFPRFIELMSMAYYVMSLKSIDCINLYTPSIFEMFPKLRETITEHINGGYCGIDCIVAHRRISNLLTEK